MTKHRTTKLLRTLRSWTPAQLAALGFGYWWTVNAVAAMLASDSSLVSLSARSSVQLLGLTITVNGWHVLFHLTTGLWGLAICAKPLASRVYAFAMAALYAVVSVWGLVVGHTAIGVVAVNTPGTVIHVIECLVILVAAVASRPQPNRLRLLMNHANAPADTNMNEA